jgi:pentose-5-phosphate-3-epimerase
MSTSDQPFSLFREGGEAFKDVHLMRENAHLYYDPECARARVDLLRHREESESQRRNQKELNVSDANLAKDLC